MSLTHALIVIGAHLAGYIIVACIQGTHCTEEDR